MRGGGHSLPGFSTSDGGIVIDLSPMKGIRVDPDAQRVVAQAASPGRARSRDAGLRAGGDGWPRLVDRRRRVHARGRDRLADAQARPGLRQPRGGRPRHGRRPARPRQRARERRALLGAAGRRRELRDRDLASSSGSTGSGRRSSPVRSSTRASRRPSPARVPRVHGEPAGRDDVAREPDDGAAGPVPAGRRARQEGRGGRRRATPGPPEDGRTGRRAAPPPRRRRSPTSSGRCPTRRCSRCSTGSSPAGARNYFKSGYLAGLSDDAIDTLVRFHGPRSHRASEIHIQHLGGAVARVPDDATAFGEPLRRPTS